MWAVKGHAGRHVYKCKGNRWWGGGNKQAEIVSSGIMCTNVGVERKGLKLFDKSRQQADACVGAHESRTLALGGTELYLAVTTPWLCAGNMQLVVVITSVKDLFLQCLAALFSLEGLCCSPHAS